MATVELRGVRKSYGSGKSAVEVIHGIDCSVADGEFIVLVGPSGCGKSTLLRMVAGLEEISAGEIAIGPRVVNQLEPKDRDVAMVFQNYALYPHMDVRQNMAYGLKIRGLPAAEIGERVARAAAMLELAPYLDRKPRQLSGGQRQRVAMGRAIVRNPQVFLFDEPLSNLDAKLRVQTRMELQKLHREFRTTSLYVTHDQVEAMTLGQRLIVMNAGVAEQIGAPLEVYNKPATTFVASFIGSPGMNLIKGRAQGMTFTGEGAAPLTIELPVPAPRDGELVLGLRPEHLAPCGASEARFGFGVEMVETLGADSYAYGLTGATTLVARVGGPLPAVGDTVPLTFEARHLHWFDAANGRRIQ
ncbi:MAG TPA: sn-glycerol-3-phosphate import ATP-binding protein UgpC [Burkholderiales bacterium]